MIQMQIILIKKLEKVGKESTEKNLRLWHGDSNPMVINKLQKLGKIRSEHSNII